MPIQQCPSCGTDTPRLLDYPSKQAAVNYYRCPQCGHVWTISKDDPARVEHVTPLPTNPAPRPVDNKNQTA